MSKYPILDDISVPEDVLENWQITADLLAEIAEVPAVLIMRVHVHEIEVFVASHSPGNVYHPGEKASLDTGLYCEMVMNTRRKLLVPNALKDPDWDHNPDIDLGMISYCGLPITWPNGDIFGTICMLDEKENAYFQRAHHLMERFRDSIQQSLVNIYESNFARSQRDEAKDALRISEERLRLATNAGNIGVWDWDVIKNELLWDDSMYANYGIREEDFGGAYDAWTRTLHPDDRQFTEGEIQAALRGEREYAPAFRIVRPDGTVRNIQRPSATRTANPCA